jgi:hypothetical protein
MNGFDVVAVGVSDEGTEVSRMVLRPQPRLVQAGQPGSHRLLVERSDSFSARCCEGDMALPVGNRIGRSADPEHRVRPFPAVAERRADVHDHHITERLQNGVVERPGSGEVINLDTEMIDHATTLAAITDTTQHPVIDGRFGSVASGQPTPAMRELRQIHSCCAVRV